MGRVWTSAEVTRIMEAERERVHRDRLAVDRPRLEAIQVVRDAIAEANRRYTERFTRMKRDLDIGLIGPDDNGHKTQRLENWLATEVRQSLLRELHNESPIGEEDENA